MRVFLSAAAALLATGLAVHAGEIAETSAYPIELGDVHGVAYYTSESDGLRVVATLETFAGAQPMRVSTLLAPGQSLTLSVPGAAGSTADEIAFVHAGDAVAVTRREPATN